MHSNDSLLRSVITLVIMLAGLAYIVGGPTTAGWLMRAVFSPFAFLAGMAARGLGILILLVIVLEVIRARHTQPVAPPDAAHHFVKQAEADHETN